MGLSSSKTKTNSTSNSTITPQAPSWIEGPYRDFFNQVGALGGANAQPTTTPASVLQERAFAQAGGLGGDRSASARAATAGLLGYNPGSVTAGSLADTDLSAYTNPWEDAVVNSALGDIERFRGMGINQNSSAATLQGGRGGFGGSRAGVSDSLTNEAALREAGSTAARLRQAGYVNAQQGAQFDIGNRLSADQFNVNSDLAGAGLRLGAAGQLGDQQLAEGASNRADIGLMGELGGEQRDIAEQNDPQNARMLYLARLASLLSAGNPSLFTGQNQQGTSSGTTTSTPSVASMLGTAAQTAASLFTFSDRRLKRNIEHSHTDANGIDWYRYEYIWGGGPQLGVMADEAPAHAVEMHPSGYLMVRYDLLHGAL